jgi:hypothetical protein
MLNNHSRTPNILSVIFVTPFLSFSISPVPHHPSNRMSYFLFCLGNCRHLVRKCHKLPYPPLDLIPPFSPRLCVLLSSGSPFFFKFQYFCLALVAMGLELRNSYLQSRHSTTWATPSHFCSAYFGDEVSQTICPGWPELQSSRSQPPK